MPCSAACSQTSLAPLLPNPLEELAVLFEAVPGLTPDCAARAVVGGELPLAPLKRLPLALPGRSGGPPTRALS